MGGIKAVVFDLYGTLIYLSDTRNPYLRLFHHIGVQRQEVRQASKVALTEDSDDIEAFVRRIKPDVAIDVSPYKK